MRLLLATWLVCASLAAETTRVYTLDRTDVLSGRPFGEAGPYERIVAQAHFAADPKAAANAAIRDLGLAPRDSQGLVRFSADVYVLKPRDPAKGNGTVLLEVSNRGGKSLLPQFNYGSPSLDPQSEEHFGDKFLLEEGYTLVWVGWQWDVPPGNARLRLDAPVASLEGKPVRGLVRSEYVADAPSQTMPIGASNGEYAALAGEPATLTVRDSVLARRTRIPESDWKFNAARTAVEMPKGFIPGRIYELVYTAENPRVAGLGMAAVRDFISYLKYGGDGLSVLGDQRRYIKRALAYGNSQSGRWLRTFLYYGQNEDEKGRKVFDGVWAHVAGAGRGGFNHRFGQPGRSGGAHVNTLYPIDLFPFSDVPQPNPETGEVESLLMRVRPAVMPVIIYTNTASEYWHRCASLIHTSPDGALDAPLPPQTRLYFISAAQHGTAPEPREDPAFRHPTNPNEFRPLQRALLVALHEWVRDGKAPPGSVYPLIAEQQLVPAVRIRFPAIPGASLPRFPNTAYELDYGPRFKDEGIAEREPPRVGRAYPVLAPQADSDGMDLGGIRMPAMQVPLGTATGWNLRSPAAGAPDRLAHLAGAWFPLPASRKQRESRRDPRLSVEERYASREDYLERVQRAAEDLASRRLLLPRDFVRIREHASRLWESVMGQQ